MSLGAQAEKLENRNSGRPGQFQQRLEDTSRSGHSRRGQHR